MAAFEFEPAFGGGEFGERASFAADGVDDGVFEGVAGDGGFILLDLGESAGGDDFSAEAPGGGAEVDDVSGAGHGVVIVFDDEEGIALLAEGIEGIEEFLVVAGVESDGGFVEDVEDAAEVGA